MTVRVSFLGGNGHCAARLAVARPLAAARGLSIDDVPYPGFEGRPPAPSLDALLDAIAASLRPAAFVYATGIGGLLALLLRASDRLPGPLLLQAPVLWGVERRWMPHLMRAAPVRLAARRLFATGAFQALFVRRFFERPLAAEERVAFFDGYARCAALADLFAWLTPAHLRALEERRARDPSWLAGIDVWWGACDRVVTLDELRWTERALNVAWPRRVFERWGHYPMIDAPEEWVDALAAHAGRLRVDGRL